jgi:membrane protease YdiL (CAAX protease family)
VVLLLGAWNNVVVPRFPVGWYVPVNVAATGALLAAARRSGLSWADLGLAREPAGAGLRWGGAAGAVVAAGLAVALAVPALRPLLTDARVAGLDAAGVAGQALVRIPLGTVLWEEVAFRGVLLAALARVLPLRTAVLVSAAVFGVWHVRPTISAVAANDLVTGPVPTALVVGAGCLATAVAGLVFTWLRLRSGSLLAPVLLHLATNCLGLLAAVAATAAAADVRLGSPADASP